MKISKTIPQYPWPYLSSESYDYQPDYTFGLTTEAVVSNDSNEITFSYEIDLDCPGLYQLVEAGDACVVIRSECSHALKRYDEVIPNLNVEYKRTFNLSDIPNDISFQAFVASTKEQHLLLEEWDQDLFTMPISVSKYGFLAESNINKFRFETQLMPKLGSIIDIGKEDAQEESIKVDYEGEHIVIHLNQETHDYWRTLYNNLSTRKMVDAIFYYPVIIDALHLIDADEDHYMEYKWARVLRRKLSVIDDDLHGSGSTYVDYANRIIGDPVKESTKKIVTFRQSALNEDWDD